MLIQKDKRKKDKLRVTIGDRSIMVNKDELVELMRKHTAEQLKIILVERIISK